MNLFGSFSLKDGTKLESWQVGMAHTGVCPSPDVDPLEIQGVHICGKETTSSRQDKKERAVIQTVDPSRCLLEYALARLPR